MSAGEVRAGTLRDDERTRDADPALLDGKRRMNALDHVKRVGPELARPLLGLDFAAPRAVT